MFFHFHHPVLLYHLSTSLSIVIFEASIKVKCIENGTTQAQLAETIGTTGQYVNRIIKKQDGVVNKTFVQMLEALGYDIKLSYVKRKSDIGDDTF